MTEQTFSEIYASFLLKQEREHQDTFTAACYVFLQFEPSRQQATRLGILYILYRHYAILPLDHNPFLTFFLQLTEELPTDSIERHFVFCILEQSLPDLENTLPHELSSHILPPIQQNAVWINTLKLKVARLIDDPDIVILNQNTRQLLSEASTRKLTLPEHELLSHERLSDYPLCQLIPPNQLPSLIDFNQFLALDIVPILLGSNPAYLQSLLDTPVSIHSLEVVHHVLMNHMVLPEEFLHYYISNSIRSCDQLEEGPKRDRQVKQVTRFIQSLLEKKIIPISDYFVEIQSFCVSYMKLKGVAQLFRLCFQ
ncbi:uncharacterized protein B0P05DRAFT_546446 [Gilbertella persicaria]|uniref:uncharacterized protein n=1 Tax=Gilbertella persicaria TaxID=101096 RepID=UPI00221E4612|nr:uncharacterized protein B0P05DRAFT_546446 [Gilbertella persicaria]KAI8075798.1 hypothetical protein B0P05DRAFT_546446 [Gilbertella persicaria]